MMKPSPWLPLQQKSLPYRHSLLKELKEALLSIRRGIKVGYLIYGPYGIGKTSILLSLQKWLEEEHKFPCIYIDAFWQLLIPEDIIHLILDSLTQFNIHPRLSWLKEMFDLLEDGKIGEAIIAIDDLLRAERLYLALLVDEVGYLVRLSKHFGMRENPAELFKVLNESSRMCIVISEVTPHRALKACGRSISLFTSRHIPPLNFEETSDLLRKLLGGHMALGKSVIREIWKLSGGIPLYLHIIAMELIRAFSQEGKIGLNDAMNVISDSINEPWGLLNLGLRLLHRDVVMRLHAGGISLKLLSLIAKGIKDPKSLARHLGKPYQYVSVYIRRLEEAGVLTLEKGEVKIIDSLYACWLNSLLSKGRNP